MTGHPSIYEIRRKYVSQEDGSIQTKRVMYGRDLSVFLRYARERALVTRITLRTYPHYTVMHVHYADGASGSALFESWRVAREWAMNRTTGHTGNVHFKNAPVTDMLRDPETHEMRPRVDFDS